MVVSHSRVFCSSLDPSTEKTSWCDGRLSDGGVLTLAYWSAPEPGISRLAGVILLEEDVGFEVSGTRLCGVWTGYTRAGLVERGETVWTKVG